MDDQIGAWLGIGNYVGETRLGPDGNVYQWDEGVDGLGNPVGFWKAIRRGVRAVRSAVRHPLVRQALPLIPGAGPAVAAGLKAAEAAGLGEGDFVGQLREDSNGTLYQWEEAFDGIGNPIGFWKAIRRGVGAIRKVARHPLVRQALPLIPGAGPALATGLEVAKAAGLGWPRQDYG